MTQSNDLKPQDIHLAYQLWCRNQEHLSSDDDVRPYLISEIKKFEKGQGWFKKVRQALFISTNKMAERLEVTKSAYCKMEKNEALGSVTLKTMLNVAEAMDCELVYALRPKKKVPFSEIIWQRLLKESNGNNWVKNSRKGAKANALAYIANLKFNDPEFRRRQEWSQR